MAKITKLQNVKDLKKLKILDNEIGIAIKIMDLSIKSLVHYKKFIAVQECLSMLQSNKTLLEIHHNKNKRNIEKLEKE